MVAEAPAGERLVLVGHSAAGRLIPLVAEQLGDPACVFVDAQLPGFPPPDTDGEDWFLAHVRSLAVHGTLPPWSEWWGAAAWERLVPDPERRATLEAAMPRVPLRAVEEVPPTPTAWDGRAAYLQLSELFTDQAGEAARRGWPVTHLDGGHLHFTVAEDAVAFELTGLADLLGT